MLDHQDDLLADLLRFFPQFGTHPLEVIDGPTFFALAYRLPAYGGVMTIRAQEAVAEPSAPSTPLPELGGQVVELDTFRAQFPGLVEVVSVSG